MGTKFGPKMDLINEKNGTPLSIKPILITTHMSAHIEVICGYPERIKRHCEVTTILQERPWAQRS